MKYSDLKPAPQSAPDELYVNVYNNGIYAYKLKPTEDDSRQPSALEVAVKYVREDLIKEYK